MTARLIIFFVLACAMQPANAQSDSSFQLRATIRGAYNDFTVDHLGNIYVINGDGQLKKLGPAGDSIAVYNELSKYGKPDLLDVTNPLKLLLYYRDFGTLVALDRFLAPRNTIDLRRLQLFQVRTVGLAYDNDIWVFDEMESRLKKISDDGRIVSQFNDFRQIFDSVPSPDFIIDQNKYVYLYDLQKGVYIFDYYGTLKSRLPFTGWTDFTVISNTVYGRDANMLYKYEPGTLNLQQYRIPAFMGSAKKIRIAPGNIYLLRGSGIEIYSYR